MDLEAVRAEIAAEIKKLQRVYDALGTGGKKPRKPMSAAGRRKIAKAQRARWKKVRLKAA